MSQLLTTKRLKSQLTASSLGLTKIPFCFVWIWISVTQMVQTFKNAVLTEKENSLLYLYTWVQIEKNRKIKSHHSKHTELPLRPHWERWHGAWDWLYDVFLHVRTTVWASEPRPRPSSSQAPADASELTHWLVQWVFGHLGGDAVLREERLASGSRPVLTSNFLVKEAPK